MAKHDRRRFSLPHRCRCLVCSEIREDVPRSVHGDRDAATPGVGGSTTAIRFCGAKGRERIRTGAATARGTNPHQTHRFLDPNNRGRNFDTMMLTLRWPLLRLAVAGCLLAGIPACTGEVTDGEVAEEADLVLAEQEDTQAHTREAAMESDLVLAEQGDAEAQGRLGAAYYDGRGVAQDDGEAVRWARLAAEQGDAGGQGILASAYNTGRGVAQDFGEAVRWARLAAERGDAGGQSVLGFAYYGGRGVTQDDVEAAHWARLAAEQGNASGQTLLGMMYMQGRGMDQDDISAYMWLTLGASGLGIRGAREMRDDVVARRMTPEQIVEAQALARDWGK